MRFFAKQRPEVYIHTARLKRDKKTGRRLWQFTLIVTLRPELVESCDVPVAKAWDYITAGEAAAVEVLLACEVQGCAIDFFAEIDDAMPVLHLDGVDLTALRLTRDKNTVEFWFSGEHVNEGGIHDFMKPYAYTRVWAELKPSQGDLPVAAPETQEELKQAVLPALDDMTAVIREGGVESITIQAQGMDPVTIDRQGADRIHEQAQAAKRKKAKPRDPG